MPWAHCDQSDLPDDVRVCPTCGAGKERWTVALKQTRKFILSRKRTLELRLWDEGSGEVVPLGGEPYRIFTSNGALVLDEGTLDGDGYVKIEAGRGFKKAVQVMFPERGAEEVELAPECKATSSAPGRFLCSLSGLYEFRLAEPAIKLSTELGEPPVVEAATDEGEVPVCETAADEGEVPVCETAAGEGDVPVCETAADEGDVPVVETGTDEGDVPVVETGAAEGEGPPVVLLGFDVFEVPAYEQGAEVRETVSSGA